MSSQAIEKAVTDIQKVLETCNVTALAAMPVLSQAVTLATGVNQLRHALTEDIVKAVFVPLQGSPLGFVTDKDRDGGYPAAVIRDCVIEALVQGLRPIGNEFNVIAGRMYAAKNGLMRLVQEFPGVTDLQIIPGVPAMTDKGALVPMRLTLRRDGKPLELVRELRKAADGTLDDTRIPIRLNAGMGVDAVIGKATRKILKAALDMLRGNTMVMADGDAIETVGEIVQTQAPVSPEQDGRRVKLGGKNGNVNVARKPEPEPDPAHDPETGEVFDPEHDGRDS